jgi:6-phosphofructokinase 1
VATRTWRPRLTCSWRPWAFDRILATRLGGGATEALQRGASGVLVGEIKGEIRTTLVHEVVGKQKPIDLALLEVASALAK